VLRKQDDKYKSMPNLQITTFVLDVFYRSYQVRASEEIPPNFTVPLVHYRIHNRLSRFYVSLTVHHDVNQFSVINLMHLAAMQHTI
jgi:hypothetical protein